MTDEERSLVGREVYRVRNEQDPCYPDSCYYVLEQGFLFACPGSCDESLAVLYQDRSRKSTIEKSESVEMRDGVPVLVRSEVGGDSYIWYFSPEQATQRHRNEIEKRRGYHLDALDDLIRKCLKSDPVVAKEVV